MKENIIEAALSTERVEGYSKPLNSKTARTFIKKELTADLKDSMRLVLKEVTGNGVLDQFWKDIDKANQKDMRKIKHIARQRVQLEQGSNYNSDNDSDYQQSMDPDSDWSAESSEYHSSDEEYDDHVESNVDDRENQDTAGG